jgi:hypothetical protein
LSACALGLSPKIVRRGSRCIGLSPKIVRRGSRCIELLPSYFEQHGMLGIGRQNWRARKSSGRNRHCGAIDGEDREDDRGRCEKGQVGIQKYAASCWYSTLRGNNDDKILNYNQMLLTVASPAVQNPKCKCTQGHFIYFHIGCEMICYCH